MTSPESQEQPSKRRFSGIIDKYMTISSLKAVDANIYYITCRCKKFKVYKHDLSRDIINDKVVDFSRQLFECVRCKTIYKATGADMIELKIYLSSVSKYQLE